jgi:hypothetical protein
MRVSDARVTAGAPPGNGLVVARAPPHPVSAAIEARQTVTLRVDIDDPRCGWVGSICAAIRRAASTALRRLVNRTHSKTGTAMSFGGFAGAA